MEKCPNIRRKQEDILFDLAREYPVSADEIAQKAHRSRQGVYATLNAFVAEGTVEIVEGYPKKFKLTPAGWERYHRFGGRLVQDV